MLNIREAWLKGAQLYIHAQTINMDIVEIFRHGNVEFEIVVRDLDGDAIFDCSDVEKVLGIKNIRQVITDYGDDKRLTLQVDSGHGVRSKTFLTGKGMMEILYASRKPIAEKFKDWVYDVVRTIATTGRYELQAKQLAHTEMKIAESAAEATHLTLLETYANTPVVYLGFMERLTPNEWVMKVGGTGQLQKRKNSLVTRFGSVQFMYVMAVRQNWDFETFLKDHPFLSELKYEELINGLNRSTETFRVTDAIYKKFKAMMKREVHRYNCLTNEEEMKMRQMMVEEKQAESEMMKSEVMMKEEDRKSKAFDYFSNLLNDLRADVKTWSDKLVHDPKDKEIQGQYDKAHESFNNAFAWTTANHPEVNDNMDSPEPSLTTLQQRAETIRAAHNKPRNVARGEFVQRYDPETLELVDHFAGPTEAIRQFETGCPQILMKAAKERLIYKGHRWATVHRDGDPTKPQDIGETMESRQGGGGMVAVYSRDETRIEHVFPDQLTTRDHLKVKSAATICQAIKSDLKRKCAGVYVQMWADVPAPLKSKYLEANELPKPAERKGGIPVLRIDMHTCQVLERHPNVASVAKDFRMSHMTVKQACETGEAHAGFRWRFEVHESQI
jgi:prophage antirepressor-like protein